MCNRNLEENMDLSRIYLAVNQTKNGENSGFVLLDLVARSPDQDMYHWFTTDISYLRTKGLTSKT